MDLQVDMVFSRSVEHQFREFERGFLRGCPSPAWRMFLPDQLMTLLKGEEIFNWDDLRQVRHSSITLQIHQTPQDTSIYIDKYLNLYIWASKKRLCLSISLLLQNAIYQGCTSNNEVIKNFWIVFEEFSVEQKKDFLSK